MMKCEKTNRRYSDIIQYNMDDIRKEKRKNPDLDLSGDLPQRRLSSLYGTIIDSYIETRGGVDR